MDWLSLEELKDLLHQDTRPRVSLFMPTHRAGVDTQQDPIRLRNLLREADEQLRAFGLRSPDARVLLEPAEKLRDDPAFWRHMSDGLALFLAADAFHYYRLPLDFGEMVVVAERFHVKPLLPLFTGDGHFFVLAISQNEVRLFEGTRHHVDELQLPGVPTSLEDALADDDPEKHLQMHTRTSAGPIGQAAAFHGHDPADDATSRLLRYFNRVDDGLRALLRREHSPLVLAGVDYLLPIYRQANSYPHVLDEGVTGSPEQLTAADLHAAAWQIVQPYFQQKEGAARAQYRQLAGTGKTSTRLAEVVLAAHHGQIETLFVPSGSERWGRYYPDTDRVDLCPEPLPGCQDLLDLAAVQTILAGGTVYAVEPPAMPDDAPLAAVLRY